MEFHNIHAVCDPILPLPGSHIISTSNIYHTTPLLQHPVFFICTNLDLNTQSLSVQYTIIWTKAKQAIAANFPIFVGVPVISYWSQAHSPPASTHFVQNWTGLEENN